MISFKTILFFVLFEVKSLDSFSKKLFPDYFRYGISYVPAWKLYFQ